MTKSLLDAIAKSRDRKWLDSCRAHNLQLGNKEVIAAIDQRFRDLNLDDGLRRRTDANSIEERVRESVRVYRELLRRKYGRGQAAGYTEREIRDYGEREALIRTIRRANKTDGLKLLAQPPTDQLWLKRPEVSASCKPFLRKFLQGFQRSVRTQTGQAPIIPGTPSRRASEGRCRPA